jgi:hypothetical protein
MGTGNDLLGLGAIEMRAPVSHDTVSAVRATVFTAITND